MAAKTNTAPGTDRIYVIGLVHLILCIFIIAAMTPGNESLSIGGVLIAPTLQWWNTAFTAFTIVSIILACVGVLYLIEWHLDLYCAVLAVSIAIDLMWFGVFLVFGASCSSGESSMSCTFNAGVIVLLITAIVLFKIFAVWSVLKAKRAVRIKYNEDLLPFLRRTLTKSFGTAGEGNMLEDDAAQANQVGYGENAKTSWVGACGAAGAGHQSAGYQSAGFATKADGMSMGCTGGACMGTTGGYGAINAPANSVGNTSYYGSNNVQGNASRGVSGGFGQGCTGSMPAAAVPLTGNAAPVGAPPTSFSMGAAPMAIPSGIAPIGGTPPPVGSLPVEPLSSFSPPLPPPAYASAPPGVLQSMSAVPGTPVAVPMAGTGVISVPCAAPSVLAGAEAIFEQIDKDHDGVITRTEFEKFLRSGSAAASSDSS